VPREQLPSIAGLVGVDVDVFVAVGDVVTRRNVLFFLRRKARPDRVVERCPESFVVVNEVLSFT
jgi:hypothetical protein